MANGLGPDRCYVCASHGVRCYATPGVPGSLISVEGNDRNFTARESIADCPGHRGKETPAIQAVAVKLMVGAVEQRNSSKVYFVYEVPKELEF